MSTAIPINWQSWSSTPNYLEGMLQEKTSFNTLTATGEESGSVFAYPSLDEVKKELLNVGYSKKEAEAEIKALSGLSGYDRSKDNR